MTTIEPVETLNLGGTTANLWDRLFGVRYPYIDRYERQRARTLVVLSIATILAAILIDGLLLMIGEETLQGVAIQIVVLVLVCTAVYGFTQTGRLQLAGFIFVISIIVINIALSFPDNANEVTLIAFALPTVSAAYLLGPWWSIGVALIAGGSVWGLAYTNALQGQGDITVAQIATFPVLAGSSVLVLVGAISGLITNGLRRLAQDAQRTASQMEAASLIGETASTAPTVGALLNLTVERIRDTFGFYHAQVFLVDEERRMARLEASTGRAGVALLARGHALPVGSRSVIGQTTYSGKMVIVNDIRDNPTHRVNELLPDTRAELALPLRIGDEIIGALDVQSVQYNAFQADDIKSLQVIATQLASYIEKTQLVSQLQQQAADQQSLIEQSQSSLRQIEDLNKRLTREGWSEYLQGHRSRGPLGYTLQGETVQQDTDWTAPMRQAYQGEQSVVIRQDQSAHIAALPVRVRGEVIGVLEIERDGNHPWTESDLEMAETLIGRLALALENARLYEQATLAAEREHIVNKIAQDVQQAESVDDILQAALSELSNVLGASRGVVQINPKPEGKAS
jgi:GAF domain-containing protein